jgi:hypothetical protein
MKTPPYAVGYASKAAFVPDYAGLAVESYKLKAEDA